MAATRWEVSAAVHMGAETGTIQVMFAFPLPPYLEKQLPSWEYFRSLSLPVRGSLRAATMGLEECQERGNNCQETPGRAAKTSLPTQGEDFLQTQLKIAPPPESAGQNKCAIPKDPFWL